MNIITHDFLRKRATIVGADRGGPIRTIINGAARRATGRYSSAKTGRAQPWESKIERSHFWRCEADPRSRHFSPSPIGSRFRGRAHARLLPRRTGGVP